MSSTVSTVRRTTLTVALAGALLGFAAPAASAAPAQPGGHVQVGDDYEQDGPSYLIEAPGKKDKGSVLFMVNEKGDRKAVVFCDAEETKKQKDADKPEKQKDAEKPKKQKKGCVQPVLPTGPRF